jgi:hypothetical protein
MLAVSFAVVPEGVVSLSLQFSREYVAFLSVFETLKR